MITFVNPYSTFFAEETFRSLAARTVINSGKSEVDSIEGGELQCSALVGRCSYAETGHRLNFSRAFAGIYSILPIVVYWFF